MPRFPPGWTDEDEDLYRETVAESGAGVPSRERVMAQRTPSPAVDLGRTADGREFPTYQGEILSWDIGSSFTPRDQSEGYPRTRAIVRAFAKHRPEQLARERSSLINGSFDRMFGHNATKLLSLIDEERHQGDTPASRAASLSSLVTRHSLTPHAPGARCVELGCRVPPPVDVGTDIPAPKLPPGKARCSVCGKVGSRAALHKHEAKCKSGKCPHGPAQGSLFGNPTPAESELGKMVASEKKRRGR